MKNSSNLIKAAFILATSLLAAFPAISIASPETEEGFLSPPMSASPVAAPNGGKILFVSNATGRKTIWSANRDGSDAKPLINWPESIQKDPDWSPDGRKIVFSSNRGGTYNIWSANPDGGGLMQITANVEDNEYPRYSPNGEKLIFTSDRTGKREIWIMNPDGSEARAVGLQSILVSDPTWSPNGREIAFVGCTRPPDGGSINETVCNLFATTLDAGSTRQLTTGKFLDWNPDWGPNGIVFSSSRTGGQRLWVVNGNGSGLSQLNLATRGSDEYPRWDRQTGRILFSSEDRDNNIWSTDISGGKVQITRIANKTNGGDVNADGSISCLDLALIRSSFGRKAGQAGYDLRADLNQDGIVDARDLGVASKRLPSGSSCK